MNCSDAGFSVGRFRGTVARWSAGAPLRVKSSTWPPKKGRRRMSAGRPDEVRTDGCLEPETHRYGRVTGLNLRAGHDSEVGVGLRSGHKVVAERGARVARIEVVQGVEGLDPELQALGFGDL